MNTTSVIRVAPYSPAMLAQIVRHAAGQPGLWRELVRYEADERYYARLSHDDQHEVWLLTWLPGQQTGFHDHGSSSGAFVVADGRLTEQAAAAGRPEPTGRTLRRGACRSFGAHYQHNVRNDWTEPAVSIHAYSPPLTSMRRYDVTDGGLLRATAEDRSW